MINNTWQNDKWNRCTKNVSDAVNLEYVQAQIQQVVCAVPTPGVTLQLQTINVHNHLTQPETYIVIILGNHDEINCPIWG